MTTQYIRLPKAVVFMYGLKKCARLVLEYLTMKFDYFESKHKNAEEIYYNISQKKLAEELNMSLRSVSSAIRQLKELGMIRVRQHSESDCTLDYIKTDITETEIFKNLDDSKKYLYEGKSIKDKDTDDTTMPCEVQQTPEVAEKSIDDDVVTLMDNTNHKFSQKQIQKLINIIKEKDNTANPVEIITRVYRRMRDGGFKIKKWFSYLLKSVKAEVSKEETIITENKPIQQVEKQNQSKPQQEETINLILSSTEQEYQKIKLENIREREEKARKVNSNNSNNETAQDQVDEQTIVSLQLKIMQDFPQCAMTKVDLKSLWIYIKKTLVANGVISNIFVYILQLCNRVITNMKYNHTIVNNMVAYMISIVNSDMEKFKYKSPVIEEKDKPSYDLDKYMEDLQKYY